MKSSLFDYQLPKDLIARYPAERRTHSRLLVVDRVSGSLQHDQFFNIGRYLKKGDLLVINDSRVLPARLMGKRSPSGGKVEVLLIREIKPLSWLVMVKPGKKIDVGDLIIFEPKLLEGKIIKYCGPGERVIEFTSQGPWNDLIRRLGHTPLPPYILKARRDDKHTDFAHVPLEESGDRDRYQTVYAQKNGSIAAPTAGLHFSKQLLSQLTSSGIEFATITLHIGPGTFKPITSENIEEHDMHSEIYQVLPEEADKINLAIKQARRIIPVGTTAVRTLETCADENGYIKAGAGETKLMITPNYRFKSTDALITNFHLPRSTLIILVCAFGGIETIMHAYRDAITKRYRFYSYGDAMLIQ